MHTTRTANSTAAQANALTAVLKTVLSPVAAYLKRQKNRREVEAMLDLNPHLLRDIGLTRGDVADAAGANADPAAVLNARRAERLARDARALSIPARHAYKASCGRSLTVLSNTLTGGHWAS